MNTAKSLIPITTSQPAAPEVPVVSADTPVVELLPRLLDSPSHTLRVAEGERQLGLLTETLLLEGLAREFVQRDDCATITLRCNPSDYSASRIAVAVEDAGCHLLDLWSGAAPDGRTQVSIRVRCDDPSATVHSLERYGFEVTDVYSASSYFDAEQAAERLFALQAYLNV